MNNPGQLYPFRFFRQYGVSGIIILLVLTVCSSVVKGQFREHTFTQYSINNGLSQNSVLSIHKDHRGFVWIGTYDGLNRFDGVDFKIFRAEQSEGNAPMNNVINGIAEDKERDKLYIATGGGGLSIYDPVEDKFENYVQSDDSTSIISNYLYDIEVADDGRVWIAGSRGVSVFDPMTRRFVNYLMDQGKQDDLEGVLPLNLFLSSKGEVWVGTNGDGIVRINQADGPHQVFMNDLESGNKLQSNSIKEIFEDKNGHFLIATGNGVYRFDPERFTFDFYLLQGMAVSGLVRGTEDDIWISTAAEGLYRYNRNGLVNFENNPFDHHSMPDDHLASLYVDDSRIMWIGTKSNGLVMMPLQKNLFKHYYGVPNRNSLNGNTVFALEDDGKGNVYIGTYNGLSVWNRESNRFKSIDLLNDGKDLSVWCLYYEEPGVIWAGTSGGLVRYVIQTGRAVNYKQVLKDKLSLPNNNVIALERDQLGRLWVGTQNGLCRMNERDQTFIVYEPYQTQRSISNNIIWDIHCDSTGRLWVCTEDGLNLYHYTTDDFTVIRSNEDDQLALSSSNITTISEGSEGNMWLATAFGVDAIGKSLLVNRHYGEEEGMDNGFTYAAREHNGYLWVSTNKGISRIDLRTNEVMNFDYSNGVQGGEFTPASLVLDDGSLLFGGVNGFNIFHPDSFQTSYNVPPIYFTGLQLYGHGVSLPDSAIWKDAVMEKSFLTASEIRLDYKERFLTLEFSALDFKNPGKIEYYYRLQPNSKHWLPLKNQRYLTFINLRPGSYNLEVRSTNADGVLCNNVKRLSIVVVPPFWKSAWFILLILALVAGAIYLMVKYRFKMVRKEKLRMADTIEKRTYDLEVQRNIAHKQRDEIGRQKAQLEDFALSLETKVKERTSELEQAKLDAEESDRLKTAFLSNMSHEIRTPMNAIIGFSELLLDHTLNADERLEFARMIRTNGDELLNLLNDIIDISMIESGQMKVNLSTVWLNEELRTVYSTFGNSRYLTEKDRLQFRLEIPEQDMSVKSDPFRLRQVLNNLTSNALKFTSEGCVTLGYKIVNGNVRFYVEDTGIGIDEEHQRSIFERFLKVKNDVSNLYRGNGLGLTISKNLVEILGGKMYLRSRVGEGSYFYFELPLQ